MLPFIRPNLIFVPKRYESLYIHTYWVQMLGIMGRQSIRDEFSFSELAIVGDMSKRAIQHLADGGLLPEGRGIAVLKRVAVIGGFVGGGVPLLAAGRIADAVLSEFNQEDGEVPSGLNDASKLRRLPAAELAEIPRDANDYWYHQALWKHSELYQPGVVFGSDALIEIADKTHLFLRSASGIGIRNPWTENAEAAAYIGQLDGWERGSEAHVTLLIDVVPLDLKRTGRDVSEVAQQWRASAVAMLTVNISLAVRRGLDRLALHREAGSQVAP